MPQHDALTELILEVFRLNGRLLSAGDDLVLDIGLTSARWQVLGAVTLADAPLPVAGLARNMGLSRQAVQRLVNEMTKDGLLRLAPNPLHRRAHLVLLTARGTAAYKAAMRRQKPWVKELASKLDPKKIRAAQSVLKVLRHKLEANIT